MRKADDNNRVSIVTLVIFFQYFHNFEDERLGGEECICYLFVFFIIGHK